jgi:Calcineurin-like phosphoesterase
MTAPDAVIVSTSGIPHADVADYTTTPLWTSAMPQGFAYRTTWPPAINRVITRIATEAPDAVLHTGDMVEGRWGEDIDGVGMFGPVDTLTQRKAALHRAADAYYGQLAAFWPANGIPLSRVHFGMGDHEYGNVDGDLQPRPGQWDLITEYRRAWARHFADDRSYPYRLVGGQQRRGCYGVMLPGHVGLVTLDPIVATGGLLHPLVWDYQRDWLAVTLRALRSNGARWLFVQTEIPMRGPNRKVNSSGLILENGAELWDICVAEGVDLVLASEFHAITTHSHGGGRPVQIVHGGMLYKGHANYLRIEVRPDRLEVFAKEMVGTTAKPGAMWAPGAKQAPGVLHMPTGTSGVGRGTLHRESGEFADREGFLLEGISS